MITTDKILFISAGMLSPKKRDHLLARRQLYLNYGALTLATLLQRNGHHPILIHGNHILPELFVDTLAVKGLLPTTRPVMLSIPSYYALSWAQCFCHYLKMRFPETKIVIGGRWVVGPDPQWLKQKIPEIDLLTTGLAEGLILDVAEPFRWSELNCYEGAAYSPQSSAHLPAFNLDHLIVDDFQKFQPSIEVSRGCGMGCAFCEERAIPLTKIRSPDVLAQHLSETILQYGSANIRPYFQSSFFVPNPRWSMKLFNEIQNRNSLVRWRCETRIDCLSSETIELLAKSGLRVLDLGMETASLQQILRMKKAQKPEQYLRRASDVLRQCKTNGISAKINILLYAGETYATVEETKAWLKENAANIAGVSVGPVLIFGPPKQAMPLISEMEEAGARVVDPASAEATGVTGIHPSCEISATEAEEISLSLSRMMMDHRAYYELKSFSYYPRDYTYEDFSADVRGSEAALLPFDTSTLAANV